MREIGGTQSPETLKSERLSGLPKIRSLGLIATHRRQHVCRFRGGAWYRLYVLLEGCPGSRLDGNRDGAAIFP
jgi:hypothetical protein